MFFVYESFLDHFAVFILELLLYLRYRSHFEPDHFRLKKYYHTSWYNFKHHSLDSHTTTINHHKWVTVNNFPLLMTFWLHVYAKFCSKSHLSEHCHPTSVHTSAMSLYGFSEKLCKITWKFQRSISKHFCKAIQTQPFRQAKFVPFWITKCRVWIHWHCYFCNGWHHPSTVQLYVYLLKL